MSGIGNALHITALLGVVSVSAAAFCSTADAGSDGLLSDNAGMTLYTFDMDKGGTSHCYNLCAGMWPPAIAPSKAAAHGNYSLVTRSDGAKQWAYRGKPLYLYRQDNRPGDTFGDGVKAVWHVVPR